MEIKLVKTGTVNTRRTRRFANITYLCYMVKSVCSLLYQFWRGRNYKMPCTCWQMQVFNFPVNFRTFQPINSVYEYRQHAFSAFDILLTHKRIHYVANNYDTLKVQVKAKQQIKL